MPDAATPNLPARDFGVTAAFYAALGFAEGFRDNGWMIMSRGAAMLEFFPYPDLDPYHSSFSCCLRLDDLPAMMAQVRAADIPNTVAAAMQAIHVYEPAIVTVHASGGRAMMEDAKAAAASGTKVVAVTMLTSLDAGDLTATGVYGSAETQVMRLAELAHAAGLDGIVCSGQEVAMARKAWRDGYFVVPGIRPTGLTNGGGTGDQKRVVTPRQARDNGASVLVIGRPIARAEDPVAAARAIEATL